MTVRRVDVAAREIAVDIAVHGEHGVAGPWALAAEPGQPMYLMGPGGAYTLTWGRRHSQATLDKMAERLDIDVFVVGHQAQPHGWCQAGTNLIILASDHNHGCLAKIDLAKPWTASELVNHIVPLASIA